MTLMMLSHSICLSARRILKLVTAAATLPNVGDMRSTSGFMRSGGWIEWLGLLSLVRGSSAAVRLMHLRTIANVVLPILVRAYERSEQALGHRSEV